MSALHEAARRVVADWWGSTKPSWIEDVNAAVLALDAALKAQPEPAQGPVAAAFSAAFAAEQHPTGQRIVIERRGEQLFLNGQKIGPGTLEIRRDGVTYRAAERVAVKPEPAGCETEANCDSQPWCRISGECHRKQKQPEPAQEPVAWWMPQHLRHQGKSFTSWVKDGHEKPPIYFGWVPLYTAPQPQRPPLTDEEIDRLWHDHGAGIDAERFARIARAIERKVRGEA